MEGEELDCPRWDLTLKAINQFDNPDLHFHRPEGVFIYGVKFPGNASASGLTSQDILLRLDDREVNTLDDVREIHRQALDSLPGKHRVLVTLLRNGELRQVVLDFSRDHQKR